MTLAPFSTPLIKQALNDKLTGIIHYGDVTLKEIEEYELMGIKKVLWMHPVNNYISSLYINTTTKRYKNQFVIENLSDKDTQFEKRFETYCSANIVYLNLDSFEFIKLNNIAGSKVDYAAILRGFGELTSKYPYLKGIMVYEDSQEIKELLKEWKFAKSYISNKSSIYIRE